MSNFRIEKRIPFGFRGDWGMLYKKYNYKVPSMKEVAYYQETNYYDIGMDVQFKPLDDGIVKRSSRTDDKVDKKTQTEDYRIIQTTDAYFNYETRDFDCVVACGDIVKVFGRYWVVESIEEECVYTPRKQSFYNLAVTKIASDEIITRQPTEEEKANA